MIGLDLGSRSVKIVQMNDGLISGCRLYDTIDFYRRYGGLGTGSLSINIDELGLNPDDRMIATGYGKITVKVKGAEHIPEIQAHVQGAVFQSGLRDFTLVDIGGQDTKVIMVREGKIRDFLTNDRCAASSGATCG